jgi:[ribosomal protein S5]-alanine N-acetyltransferase
MSLQTERLRLEPWLPEEWIALRPIATDPEVMRYISDGRPWPEDQIREFIQRQIRHHSTRSFCLWKLVEKATGRVIGFCGLQPVEVAGRNEIEIGWWLARDMWGQGLATEAARVALADSFDRAGLHRIIAIAQPANHASIRIMEKLGMHYEGDAVHKGINVVIYATTSSQ